jgi:hypothetical protein
VSKPLRYRGALTNAASVGRAFVSKPLRYGGALTNAAAVVATEDAVSEP